MTMFRKSLLAFVLAASSIPVAARQAPPPQRQSPPARLDEMARNEEATLSEVQLAAMLDTYAIVQAQQQLAIPDDKYGSFAARLKKLQDVRRNNQRQRRQIVQELRRLAGPRAVIPGDEATIRKQLDALRALDERAAVELKQAQDAVDELLDTRQQARFRIFEENIEQRKVDLLLRARERARANAGKSGS
jgi:hypothetical protein